MEIKEIVLKLIEATERKDIRWSYSFVQSERPDTVSYTAILPSGAKVVLINQYNPVDSGEVIIYFSECCIFSFDSYDFEDDYIELLECVSKSNRSATNNKRLLDFAFKGL